MLRKSRTVYWQKEEYARVGMHYILKQLFRKNKHQSEGMDDVIQIVVQQVEMLTDTGVSYFDSVRSINVRKYLPMVAEKGADDKGGK